MKTTNISSIHRFALDDRPGIRTTVFLKGCPLSCEWCHNPENISQSIEIDFKRSKCINCKVCIDGCQLKQCKTNEVVPGFDSHCQACGTCTTNCPTSATYLIGNEYSVEQLTKIFIRDKCFYMS